MQHDRWTKLDDITMQNDKWLKFGHLYTDVYLLSWFYISLYTIDSEKMGLKKDLTEPLVKIIEVLIKIYQIYPRIININQKVALIVKVSAASVKKIHQAMEKGERYGSNRGLCGKRETLNSFDRGLIRRIIYRLFAHNICPTVNKITEEWNNQKISKKCSKEIIWKNLNKLAFKCKSYNGKKCVMFENIEIVKLRHNFLKKIQNFRKRGLNTVYLKDTWKNCKHTKFSTWVLYAISQNTWVPNCSNLLRKNTTENSSEMLAVHFLQWFKESLLPSLKIPSVIIMDIPKYYKDLPKYYRKKFDKHLSDKHLSISNDVNEDCPYPLKLEREAEAYGHCILYLPSHHSDLNPMEYIWSQVKKFVAERKNSLKEDSDTITLQAVEHVTENDWRTAVHQVLSIEEEFLKNENL